LKPNLSQDSLKLALGQKVVSVYVSLKEELEYIPATDVNVVPDLIIDLLQGIVGGLPLLEVLETLRHERALGLVELGLELVQVYCHLGRLIVTLLGYLGEESLGYFEGLVL
jgi:hypothetical protein